MKTGLQDRENIAGARAAEDRADSRFDSLRARGSEPESRPDDMSYCPRLGQAA